MCRYRFLCAVAVALSVLVGSGLGQVTPVSVEVGFSGGNITNLMKNYSDRETSYSTTRIDLGLHPVAWAAIEFLAQHTMYGQIGELDNLMYGVGGTIIPLSNTSSFQIYLTGHYRDRRYRDKLSDITSTEFSSGEYDLMLSAAYRVVRTVSVRTGVSQNVTSYGIDEIRDFSTYDVFAGLNVTLPSRNALDVEAGMTYGNLDYVPQRTGGIRPDRSYEVLEQGDLNTFYISPRLSRTIGAKTGISLIFSHRAFVDQPDSAVVYGYSTNVLSPWASSYEGDAVLLSLKTYLVPRLIVTAGAGYWRKDYLMTVEGELREDPFMGGWVRIVSTLFARERRDHQRRLYVRGQWPISSHRGYLIEPSINLAYTHNSSTIDIYDYNDFSLSAGVLFRM